MKIVVASWRTALNMAAEHAPSQILSLQSPEAETLTFAAGRHLVVRFHDIAAIYPGLVAPDHVSVGAILDFTAAWDRRAPLLIHCWAGISRSTAAAFAVACQHSRRGDEAQIAAALRRASPMATPNSLMVQLADDLLDRNGAMVRAIAAIGRGAEATWGPPFELFVPPPPQDKLAPGHQGTTT